MRAPIGIPAPSGSVTAGDRAHVARVYTGVTIAIPKSPTELFANIGVVPALGAFLDIISAIEGTTDMFPVLGGIVDSPGG